MSNKIIRAIIMIFKYLHSDKSIDNKNYINRLKVYFLSTNLHAPPIARHWGFAPLRKPGEHELLWRSSIEGKHARHSILWIFFVTRVVEFFINPFEKLGE